CASSRAGRAPGPWRDRVHDRVRPPPLDEAGVGAGGVVGRCRLARRPCWARGPGYRQITRGAVMAEAYIVDTVRTPVAQKGGALAAVHPADLGAHVITGVLDRTGIDPAAVEDVVFGCVDTIGPQAGDIARTCWLAAGLPDEVPGTTVDRQCGSSQQAVHFAAQAVMSGTSDLIVAGGVQNMSMIPITAAMLAGREYGHENPFHKSRGWQARYGNQEGSQFLAAEMIAEKWNCSREGI